MKRRLAACAGALTLLAGLTLAACGPAEQGGEMESGEEAPAAMAADSMAEEGMSAESMAAPTDTAAAMQADTAMGMQEE